MTIAALALVTFAILLLRIFWMRVPSRARFYLIRIAAILIVLNVVFTATRWEFNNDRLNLLLKWSSVGSYELLAMLFTTLSPRWLTTICTFILMVPVFSSSIIMPLVPIFDANTYQLIPIGHNFFSQNVPWGSGDPTANSGSDLKIFYLPRFAPFLRHSPLAFPFNFRECNASASFAVLQPDRKHVLARCPRWPSQGPGTDDRLFPLH